MIFVIMPRASVSCSLLSQIAHCSGQQQLCEEFWEQEDPSSVPLHRFLDDARSLYPAVAAPLLRLLAALSSGPLAAEAASAFLDSMPGLACLHLQGDERLLSLPGNSGRVTAAQQLTIQGLSFVIQQVGSTAARWNA